MPARENSLSHFLKPIYWPLTACSSPRCLSFPWLVGDRRMSQLHQDFMGIARPTDVLTFPLDFDDRGRNYRVR